MCWEFDYCQMYKLIKLFSKIWSTKLQIKPRCFCLQWDFSCWTTNYIDAIANINFHALIFITSSMQQSIRNIIKKCEDKCKNKWKISLKISITFQFTLLFGRNNCVVFTLTRLNEPKNNFFFTKNSSKNRSKHIVNN